LGQVFCQFLSLLFWGNDRNLSAPERAESALGDDALRSFGVMHSDTQPAPRLIHQVNDPDTPVKFAIWRINSLEYHKAILCIVVKTYTQAKTPSYPQLFNSF
jgi:hypothetical protein